MNDPENQRWTFWGWGLLGLLIVVVSSTVSDYGSSWDEQVRADAGERKLSYYENLLNGNWEAAAAIGRQADNYPGFYDLNLALLRRASPLSDVVTGHLFSAFFGILAVAGAMHLGRLLVYAVS